MPVSLTVAIRRSSAMDLSSLILRVTVPSRVNLPALPRRLMRIGRPWCDRWRRSHRVPGSRQRSGCRFLDHREDGCDHIIAKITEPELLDVDRLHAALDLVCVEGLGDEGEKVLAGRIDA